MRVHLMMCSLGMIVLCATFAPVETQRVSAQEVQPWRQVFEPLTMLQLNVKVNTQDWATVVADETLDIKVPCLFWADGETPILVAVERKSATPIGDKVSVKIDMNEYVGGQKWRQLKKLRLENGDDQDVVSEGLAWYIHRLISIQSGPSEVNSETAKSYEPGLAAWVNVTLHLTDGLAIDGTVIEVRNLGVFLNNEEKDDAFLKNRGLWGGSDSTWLYKHDDRGPIELKEGVATNSPAYNALVYSPFRYASGGGKGKKTSSVPPPPNDADLKIDLETYIDMNSMLSLAAGDAFGSNPDALFNHDKNAYFTDFAGGRRIYHAHDLDAAIQNVDNNIYATANTKGKRTSYQQAAYQETILNHPDYRQQYNELMTELLGTTLHPSYPGIGMLAFLDQAETLLTDALVADPNSKFANEAEVAGRFNALRAWVVVRWEEVGLQVQANQPPPRTNE